MCGLGLAMSPVRCSANRASVTNMVALSVVGIGVMIRQTVVKHDPVWLVFIPILLFWIATANRPSVEVDPSTANFEVKGWIRTIRESVDDVSHIRAPLLGCAAFVLRSECSVLTLNPLRPREVVLPLSRPDARLQDLARILGVQISNQVAHPKSRRTGPESGKVVE